MTFLDPNNPSKSELEVLRMECAREAGWTDIRIRFGILKGKFAGEDLYKFEIPEYSISYDAILPEIQKLDAYQFDKFMHELFELMPNLDSAFLSKPWQLALVWMRVKQQK